MSLTDRVAEGPAPVIHGSPCSVGIVLKRIPPAEAKALAEMLGDGSWTAGQIYDALLEEGHGVGRQTIARHRAGKCRCGKDQA